MSPSSASLFRSTTVGPDLAFFAVNDRWELSRHKTAEKAMTSRIVSIARYPVKGLSAEVLPKAELKTGQGVAGDRRYALALADTDFDVENPQPLPKTKF